MRVAREHKRPDTLNYKSGDRWIPISSDEMLERAKNIAAGLHAIGVSRGDRVALLSDSRVEWTLTDAGSIFAGAIDVPIYPTLTPPQVRYILNDSGACVLFLGNREKFVELKEISVSVPTVKHVIFFDSDGVTAEDGLTLAQLEERGRELEQREPGYIDRSRQQTTPDDLATIIYTSGTTGEPKGVMLTHSNLVSNLIDSSGHLSFGEHDIALVSVAACLTFSSARRCTCICIRAWRSTLPSRCKRLDQTCVRCVRRCWLACRASSKRSTRAFVSVRLRPGS